MESGWRRALKVLSLSLCKSVPRVLDESASENADSTFAGPKPHGTAKQGSGGAGKSSLPETTCEGGVSSSPRSASSGTGLLRGNSRASRSTCAICLEAMKPGRGHALFTAECSHVFHFLCIASSARYGNLICPVCRANWKEVPWLDSFTVRKDDELTDRGQASGTEDGESSNSRPKRNLREREALRTAEEEQRRLGPVLRILDESIANFRDNRHVSPPEPSTYDDDEPLDNTNAVRPAAENTKPEASRTEGTGSSVRGNEGSKVRITLQPEAEAVAAASACNFTVLVNVKAPAMTEKLKESASQTTEGNGTSSPPLNPCQRSPIDLVTVLDVSGSMSGNKLALLKRAMIFVISNLSAADRLSVVAFASTAKRVFPLRRMLPEGQRAARRVIDRLACTGGTNIGEGLKKSSRVLQERRHKNPVASIMLLSDGQDTYSMSRRRAILPQLMRKSHGSGTQSQRSYPVHAFGFGVDHDAATLHAIAEESGGTFSFIQAESLVQDAFAQCIGGLLSVVIQDADLTISALSDPVRLKSIDCGCYPHSISDDGYRATVKLGDLYAEEDKNILLELKIPSAKPDQRTNLIGVKSSYRNPVNAQQIIHLEEQILSVWRPRDLPRHGIPLNLEVERQRSKQLAQKAIMEAVSLADRSNLSEAHRVLQKARTALRGSAATGTGDQAARDALESELAEIQSRMTRTQVYEAAGRAYALSALSCYFSQRATTRGESMESHSREYQTPSMVNMISRSQMLSSRSASRSANNIKYY